MGERDAEELREVLDAVGDRVPKLIHELVSAVMTTIYSREAGQQLGAAVGAFYKELVDSGIPQDEALAMSKDYIGALSRIMEKAQFHKDQG